MLEALAGEPASVRQCPMTAALVDPTMAQKKGEQLLAFAAQVVGSGFPEPGPDRGQPRGLRPAPTHAAAPE
ncbi:hypothetical protein MESS4_20072 [Mesorhizobium sp. STM 4661]|nr:hypothetical protein MESS4_20072 [Mesorhizobium sp. STM 4661]